MASQTVVVVPSIYNQVLRNFPSGFKLAFAYGSGVFQQVGHKDKNKNMLDFIFAVEDPLLWHKTNIELNPKHYSFLRLFGYRRIASIQERYGAGIYFNTLVQCEGRLVKYGVISSDRLLTDLLDWDTLYVSGRLHKPVLMIEKPAPELDAALLTNLRSAVHAAMLILPETFSEEQLYMTITNLSYSGDFRMSIGEDQNKIKNIVKPNMENFRRLYETILEKEDHFHWNKTKGLFEQPLSPSSLSHHLNLLPKILLKNLVLDRNRDGRFRDTEEVVRSLAHDMFCGEAVVKSMSQIVKSSSWSQSLKGLLTAGLSKSIRYGGAKLKKMLKSKLSSSSS
ncbi:phosphatidate cytidylyltransferase, mitochondrial-like [Lineus longissimus]|uniref:phosphatidate cytidylyltransferase, mitochondrial-like n=1 Tax=Lineus longissimus TaxID=88925 RepID=UPI00315DA078